MSTLEPKIGRLACSLQPSSKIGFLNSLFFICDTNLLYAQCPPEFTHITSMRWGDSKWSQWIMKLLLPDVPWVINCLDIFKLIVSLLTKFMEMWEVSQSSSWSSSCLGTAWLLNNYYLRGAIENFVTRARAWSNLKHEIKIHLTPKGNSTEEETRVENQPVRLLFQ